MHDDEIYGDFVTIARFAMPYQAHLLAGALEAEGLMPVIHGENFVSVYPFLVNDNNGIHVKVRASQVEAGRAVMKRIEESAHPSEENPQALDINGRIYDLVNGNCPECGTASIYLARANALSTAGVIAVVFAVTLPLRIDHNYFCYSCEHNWKA